MAEFMFLPIAAEDYEALGITEDSVIQTYLTDDGALVVRPINGEDLEDFICGGDCESCPIAGTDCDGDCFGCPCFAHCDEVEEAAAPESVCKSHGNRRDKI